MNCVRCECRGTGTVAIRKVFIYCEWHDFLRRLWEGYLPPLIAPSYPRLDSYGLTMEKDEKE